MNTRQTRGSLSFFSAIAFALLGLTPASAEQENQGTGCSLATLKGAYGLYRTGTAPYGPVAAQGLMVFNGEGGWTLRLNISRNGEISVDEEWEGGYWVNEDCTGNVGEDTRFVIVDGGKGFYQVLTREGFTAYEVGTRIHSGPGRGNRVDR
jgi:hypothetical protein